ncbi:hypothetical protein ACYZT9_04990 [Pseudomonas sp. ZT5P21]
MVTQPKNYPAPNFQNINHTDLGNRISVADNPGDIYVRVATNGMAVGDVVSVFMSKQWGSEDHTIGNNNPGYVDSRIIHAVFANEIGKKVSAYYTVKRLNDPNKVKSDDAIADVVA